MPASLAPPQNKAALANQTDFTVGNALASNARRVLKDDNNMSWVPLLRRVLGRRSGNRYD